MGILSDFASLFTYSNGFFSEPKKEDHATEFRMDIWTKVPSNYSSSQISMRSIQCSEALMESIQVQALL